MKSLFIKYISIFILFFLFFTTNLLAQPVKYTVEDEDSVLGLVTFNYNKSGDYEANFGKTKVTFQVKPHGVVETFGDFVVTISLSEGDKYYHDYFGMWCTTHVATSKGQKGFAMVYCEGDTEKGRSYYIEIWIEDKIVSKSKTVVDKVYQIV